MTQSINFCPGRSAKRLILTARSAVAALKFNTVYYVPRANVRVVNEGTVAEIIFGSGEASNETSGEVVGVAILQGGRGDRITVSDSIFLEASATGEGVGVLAAMPVGATVRYSDRRSARLFRLDTGVATGSRYGGMVDITEEERRSQSAPL